MPFRRPVPILQVVLSLRRQAEVEAQQRVRLLRAEWERQKRALEQTTQAKEQLEQRRLVLLSRSQQRTLTTPAQEEADWAFLTALRAEWEHLNAQEAAQIADGTQIRTSLEHLQQQLRLCVSRREAAELHEAEERREQRRLRERKERAMDEEVRDRRVLSKKTGR